LNYTRVRGSVREEPRSRQSGLARIARIGTRSRPGGPRIPATCGQASPPRGATVLCGPEGGNSDRLRPGGARAKRRAEAFAIMRVEARSDSRLADDPREAHTSGRRRLGAAAAAIVRFGGFVAVDAPCQDGGAVTPGSRTMLRQTHERETSHHRSAE